MPATGTLQRHAGIHQRQRAAAHRGHRRTAVALGDLGDNAQRVGEFFLFRQQRTDRPPGELAVADLAPARRTHAARLAHRIRGKIVVQHEVLAVFALKRVDDLLVLAGAEGGDAERLGLAAGEQRGTVRARQHADLGDDRPHGAGVAPVDADAGVQDGVADDVRLQVLEQRLGLVGVDPFGGERRHRLLLGGIDLVVTDLLVGLAIGFGDGAAGQRVDPGGEGFFILGRLGERPGVLGGVLGQFDDRLDHRLEAHVAEGDGAEHDILGQFLRLGLHHQHALDGAGHHQVELAALGLRGGRIEDVLPVLIADAGRGDRAEERDTGQGQRGGAADHGDDVGVVLQVVAEHGGDDLHLVAEALGEQRADRPVDQAADQHLLLGGPAFTLEEPAGDLAGGERLLLVVDGEREEVLARPGGFHPDGGAQNDGVAVAGEHGAVGLAGDLAGFQDQLAAAPVEFLAKVIEHSVQSLSIRRHRRTTFRLRRRPDRAGGGVSGHTDGAGCVRHGLAQPRAMWPETPSRFPRPRVAGSAVCRSAA